MISRLLSEGKKKEGGGLERDVIKVTDRGTSPIGVPGGGEALVGKGLKLDRLLRQRRANLKGLISRMGTN